MKVKTTLSTAQVLALNTSPVTLIAAPGTGYMINVTSCVVKYTYAAAAFATNTTLQVIQDTATVSLYQANMLGATATQITNIQATATTTTANIIENKAVTAKVATGDPTGGGTSTVTIYLEYTIKPV